MQSENSMYLELIANDNKVYIKVGKMKYIVNYKTANFTLVYRTHKFVPPDGIQSSQMTDTTLIVFSC